MGNRLVQNGDGGFETCNSLKSSVSSLDRSGGGQRRRGSLSRLLRQRGLQHGAGGEGGLAAQQCGLRDRNGHRNRAGRGARRAVHVRRDADDTDRPERRAAIYKAHVVRREQRRQRRLREVTVAAGEARVRHWHWHGHWQRHVAVAGERKLRGGQVLQANTARTRQEHLLTLRLRLRRLRRSSNRGAHSRRGNQLRCRRGAATQQSWNGPARHQVIGEGESRAGRGRGDQRVAASQWLRANERHLHRRRADGRRRHRSLHLECALQRHDGGALLVQVLRGRACWRLRRRDASGWRRLRLRQLLRRTRTRRRLCLCLSREVRGEWTVVAERWLSS